MTSYTIVLQSGQKIKLLRVENLTTVVISKDRIKQESTAEQLVEEVCRKH